MRPNSSGLPRSPSFGFLNPNGPAADTGTSIVPAWMLLDADLGLGLAMILLAFTRLLGRSSLTGSSRMEGLPPQTTTSSQSQCPTTHPRSPR
jgi:hypothetical protein